MRQIREELERKSITFVLADFSPNAVAQLDAYGLTEKIGKEHIYASILEAIEAVSAARTPGGHPGDR